MRFYPSKRSLFLKIHRTGNKRRNFFIPHPQVSRHYNGDKRKILQRRIWQIVKRQSLKLGANQNQSSGSESLSLNEMNELQERRQVFNALRVEKMKLEKELKNRSVALVKTMSRYRKVKEKLYELERLFTLKAETPNSTETNFQPNLSEAESRAKERIEKSTVDSESFVGVTRLRKLGGADRGSEFKDLLNDTFRKYAIVHKYANRWMRKAQISQRESVIIIKGSQKMSALKHRPSQEKRKSDRQSADISNRSISSSGARTEHSVAAILESDIDSPKQLPITKRIGRKRTRRGSLKSQHSIGTGADERAESRGGGKRQKRKNLKSRQSTASDVVERKTKRNRRRSRKSLEGVAERMEGREDGKGTKRRRRNRSHPSEVSNFDRAAQRPGEIKKRSSRKSRDSAEQTLHHQQSGSEEKIPKSEENVDQETTLHRKDSIDTYRRSRRSNRRKSVESTQVSKANLRSISRTSVEGSGKPSTSGDSRKSFSTYGIHTATAPVNVRSKTFSKGDTTRNEDHEKKIRKSSVTKTPSEFSLLEKYWGVSLRHSREDDSIKKLERISIVLDDLLQLETQKLPRTQSVISRKNLKKQKSREVNDLHKLLILLKECQECQRQQANTSDFGSRKQCYEHDIVRQAAGMPDCLPDDYDYDYGFSCGTICSCNRCSHLV